MNTVLGLAALRVAISQIGQKEPTGNNDGPFVLYLHDWADGSQTGQGWMKGQPWCANFASWCIFIAASALGIPNNNLKSVSSTDTKAWAVSKGLILSTPVPGCIGLLKGSGGTPGKTDHHTFIVEKVDLANGLVYSVDGNWGDQVMRTTHSISICDFVAIV